MATKVRFNRIIFGIKYEKQQETEFAHMAKDSNAAQFENNVAKGADKLHNVISASVMGESAEYPDVKVVFQVEKTKTRKETFIEAKMNHKAQMSSPRVFFKNRKWQTTYTNPVGLAVIAEMNSPNGQRTLMPFIESLEEFCGMKPGTIFLPTTKGDYNLASVKNSGVPKKEQVVAFIEKANKAIDLKNEKIKKAAALAKTLETKAPEYYDRLSQTFFRWDPPNLMNLIREHYLHAKKVPCPYMQIGDDFYRLGSGNILNPLGVVRDVPLLNGTGYTKVRFSMRSYMEILVEIKLITHNESKYSILPGTKKLNPLTGLPWK